MSVNKGFDWDNSGANNGRSTIRKQGRRGYGTMPRSPAETLEPMRASEPPVIYRKKREYHQTLVFMSGTLTTLVLIFVGLAASFAFAKYMFDKPGPLNHSDIIAIPKGEGLSAIANRLERKNMIVDKRLFKAAVMYFGVQNKLKAGEYEIPKQSSMRQVIDRLLEGKSILHSLPFPEGMTSQQLVDRMNALETLTGEITEIPAEGSMLPDTYRFTRGMDRTELIKRMQIAQDKFIDKLWNQRQADLPIKTKAEALTLASIVEKETGVAGERPHIAGVFMNRLNQGIRLQSDPTIIYGLVGGVGKLGRGIRRSEIDRHTPYNTYQIDGLPPTPIANPGRAAIEAVLNPKATEDIYFVADGTGGHIFAKTLKEHNANVRNWRQIEKKRKAEAEQRKKEEEETKKLDAENKSSDKQNDKSSALEPAAEKQQVSSSEDIFQNLEENKEQTVSFGLNNSENKTESDNKSSDDTIIANLKTIPLPQKK